MDKKDNRILALLKENSRLTSREMAEKTGLRPSTVHSRIQRLARAGIIEKFSIKLNHDTLGDNFIVYLMVTTKEDIPEKAFRDSCIEEVYGITGEFDLIMKCRFSGLEEFNRFIIGFRKLPQVEKTISMVGTVKIKE